MGTIFPLKYKSWNPVLTAGEVTAASDALESGEVPHLPDLPFVLEENERKFLNDRWSNGTAKNISLEREGDVVRGAVGSESELGELAIMIGRYRRQAIGLVRSLFPQYSSKLRTGRTSYRPVGVQNRETSWRKDDTRLHVDAFPSRPTHGERILRVFANVHPEGSPRVWRVGEPFEDLARRFLPQIPAPFPGSAWLLAAVRLTKSQRSRYDHVMLQLHDRMKYDTVYQQTCPQIRVDFRPGCTWLCFSDQTSHAAMAGQFMFEQTIYLPVDAQYVPNRSPLRTLERLMNRDLV